MTSSKFNVESTLKGFSATVIAESVALSLTNSSNMRDTDKTSTDKTSNGQMIDVTKKRQDKSSKKRSTNLDKQFDNYQLISVNEIIDISL